MHHAPRPRRPSPLLVPILAALLLAAALAAPAASAEPGEPYLVRDIDTTGEPFFEECHFTCPPPTPIFGSLIDQLTPFGDLVAFVADDRVHGFEPWISDGTPEGTRMLADACPGTCGSAPILAGVAGERLLFWGAGEPHGLRDLWTSDGTPEGTRRLDELCPELCGVELAHEGAAFAFEGSLFVEIWGGPAHRYFVWRTDGTPEGTAVVVPSCDEPGPCLRRAKGFFEYRGRLFFGAAGSLWRLAYPAATPAEVRPAPEPRSAAPLGERMVLGADSGIWVMDGPFAEPRFVAPTGSYTHVSQLTTAGDFVYFVVGDGLGQELWRTDGTAKGTAPTASFLNGGFGIDIVGVLGGGPVVRDRAKLGALPFVPPTLWRLNPLGGPQAALSSLSVQSAAVVGERIFFSAQDELGRELWVSDGTAAGTELLADIAPGPPSSEPGNGGRFVPGFAAAGDRLFFPAHHPDTDIELWALELNTEEPAPPPPPPPPPPGDEWLESAALAGFRVQVRITAGGEEIPARAEGACIPETLCVSGAVPGRSEVFVRVVGPRPNGFLWPTLVKFSTSAVEVWIEQLGTGELRYYLLEGATPGSGELPGLFDRTGFEPE